jgi:hypothetical protein
MFTVVMSTKLSMSAMCEKSAQTIKVVGPPDSLMMRPPLAPMKPSLTASASTVPP